MALLSSHPQALRLPHFLFPAILTQYIYFITTATQDPALQRGDVLQKGNIQGDGERSDVKIKVAALTHH